MWVNNVFKIFTFEKKDKLQAQQVSMQLHL